MAKQKSDKSEKKQKRRGAPKKYLFKKGQSGNLKGRPKGSISITSAIKRELEKYPKTKDKKTYLKQLVERILDKAIKEGDTQMIKHVWNYVDGLPKGRLDITSRGKEIFTKEQIDELFKNRKKE